MYKAIAESNISIKVGVNHIGNMARRLDDVVINAISQLLQKKCLVTCDICAD